MTFSHFYINFILFFQPEQIIAKENDMVDRNVFKQRVRECLLIIMESNQYHGINDK